MLFLVVILAVGFIVYGKLFTLVLNRPEAAQVHDQVFCAPRAQVISQNQNAHFVAFGDLPTRYLWIAAGNTTGPFLAGDVVTTHYPSHILGSKIVTVTNGEQQQRCTVHIIPR